MLQTYGFNLNINRGLPIPFSRLSITITVLNTADTSNIIIFACPNQLIFLIKRILFLPDLTDIFNEVRDMFPIYHLDIMANMFYFYFNYFLL